MSGIPKDVIKCIFRIACTFECNIGNEPRTVIGTGFFSIKNKHDVLVFVTNKHNLDPTLKLGSETTYRLAKISIYGKNGHPITLLRYNIQSSETADVSILYNIVIDQKEDFSPIPFLLTGIADQEYIEEKISIMDMASFIGFPGKNNVFWWDEHNNRPIARMVSISSYHDYSNSRINTTDIMLVNGLSFSGSSGSPIFLHQKGVFINSGPGIKIDNAGYVPPMLIGIMSGHFHDPVSTQKNQLTGLEHSGLSYFTKSTVIRQLIDLI